MGSQQHPLPWQSSVFISPNLPPSSQVSSFHRAYFPREYPQILPTFLGGHVKEMASAADIVTGSMGFLASCASNPQPPPLPKQVSRPEQMVPGEATQQ